MTLKLVLLLLAILVLVLAAFGAGPVTAGSAEITLFPLGVALFAAAFLPFPEKPRA